MTALAAEVIWTRILSLLYGGTVYTFSLILAVFLLGLGIGSSLGSALSRNMTRPRLALAWVQMLLAGDRVGRHMLTQSLPYWPIDPSASSSPWFTFQLDLVRSLWAMLPGAILWGASFRCAGVGRQRQAGSGEAGRRRLRGQHGRRHHRVADREPCCSWSGSAASGRSSADRAVGDGFAARARRGLCRSIREGAARGRMRLGGTLLIVGAAMLAAWLARNVGAVPGILVAYGRYAPSRLGQADVIDMREGWNASIAVTRLSNGVLNYHNAGKVQASSEPQDMRLQRMLGHMTTLIPKDPKRVLVIGFGAGVTAGAVSIEPKLEQDDRRDRAAGAGDGVAALRPAQLRRLQEPEDAPGPRRRPALPDDDGREVRRRHVGPAGSRGSRAQPRSTPASSSTR